MVQIYLSISVYSPKNVSTSAFGGYKSGLSVSYKGIILPSLVSWWPKLTPE